MLLETLSANSAVSSVATMLTRPSHCDATGLGPTSLAASVSRYKRSYGNQKATSVYFNIDCSDLRNIAIAFVE